jgi:hypothetical protein
MRKTDINAFDDWSVGMRRSVVVDALAFHEPVPGPSWCTKPIGGGLGTPKRRTSSRYRPGAPTDCDIECVVDHLPSRSPVLGQKLIGNVLQQKEE